MRGRHGAYRGGYYGGPGCDIYRLLVMIFIGIIALPLVGGYLLINGDGEDSKILGGILLIVGLVVWIACAIN